MKFFCKVYISLFLWIVLMQDYCCLYSKFTQRDAAIFSRKKRYLTFPTGANFVYQAVFVKILMQKVPKGVQWLTEFDVPFPLPTNTTFFTGFKHGHRIHRRQVFEDIATSLDRYGMNGTACVKRIVCEAKQFVPFKGKSIIKDMLSEIFLDEDNYEIGDGSIFRERCDDDLLENCPHPLLDLMLGSFTNY